LSRTQKAAVFPRLMLFSHYSWR